MALGALLALRSADGDHERPRERVPGARLSRHSGSIAAAQHARRAPAGVEREASRPADPECEESDRHVRPPGAGRADRGLHLGVARGDARRSHIRCGSLRTAAAGSPDALDGVRHGHVLDGAASTRRYVQARPACARPGCGTCPTPCRCARGARRAGRARRQPSTQRPPSTSLTSRCRRVASPRPAKRARTTRWSPRTRTLQRARCARSRGACRRRARRARAAAASRGPRRRSASCGADGRAR